MNNISEITRPKISIEDYLNSFVGNARPTRGTIHNWCQTGILPAIKIGKRFGLFILTSLSERKVTIKL